MTGNNPLIHSQLHDFQPHTSTHYTRKIVQSYNFFFIYTNIFTLFSYFFRKSSINEESIVFIS